MSVFSDIFHLEKQRRFHSDGRPDLFALFDILLIVVLLSLTGSRFFFFPGTGVALPGTDTILEQARAADMVTLKRDGVVIYKEQFLNLRDFQTLLSRGREARVKAGKRLVLLVKADLDVPLGTFLKVSSLAKEYGYWKVQIAQKPRRNHEK